ncbi:hypothetical protein [Erythrobacter sp. F6033]|uniref:hypothetical protein n=1 Tax=Erythrobacter sp. F6033 TaxID=2926401 RepID=UPI001FF15B9C|nr:hypothetical protein [Erythrobacter sp. F6033]MCK0128669.1 hypothetical protein [Erythrobacter sp. F6033]
MPENEFKAVTMSQLVDTLYGSIANFVTPSGKRAESEFATYVTPTIPLADDDLFFLTGEIPDGSAEGGDNARADAFKKRRESAFYFSNLVNFVPSVEPNTVFVTDVDENEETLAGTRKLKSFEEFRTKGQSLDKIFFEVINSARVLDRPRSAAEQEKIDQLRALLEVPVEDEVTDDDLAAADLTDDPLAGLDDLGDLDDLDLDGLDGLDDIDLGDLGGSTFLEGGDPPEPTKLMQNYNYFRNLYENAEAAMIEKLIDIERDPANARYRAKLTAIEKKKLHRLMQLWNTVGKRGKVNKIINIINALEQGGMVEYRARLQEVMENTKFDVDLIADATTASHFTSITPANLFKQESWQKFSLNNKSTYDEFSSETKSFHGKVGFVLPIGMTGAGKMSKSSTDSEEETFSDEVSISFEIAQGILVRPWFDPAFLMCRKYTMTDPATGDSLAALEDDDFVLSDGGKPPKGILPAYTTSVIFIRNLKIKSEQILDYVEKSKSDSSFSGRTTLPFLPAAIGGGRDTSKEDELVTTDRSTGEITIGGTHIVAFRGTYLNKAPNPDLEEHSDPSHWV